MPSNKLNDLVIALTADLLSTGWGSGACYGYAHFGFTVLLTPKYPGLLTMAFDPPDPGYGTHSGLRVARTMT
jgi:hypothetical protein